MMKEMDGVIISLEGCGFVYTRLKPLSLSRNKMAKNRLVFSPIYYMVPFMKHLKLFIKIKTLDLINFNSTITINFIEHKRTLLDQNETHQSHRSL